MLCLQFYVTLHFFMLVCFQPVYLYFSIFTGVIFFLISGHVFKRKTKQHSNGINKY